MICALGYMADGPRAGKVFEMMEAWDHIPCTRVTTDRDGMHVQFTRYVRTDEIHWVDDVPCWVYRFEVVDP